MRIDRLHVRQYGPLPPREFDLSAGREGLHVVFGGNEWGKSLSLQALEQALFSIPRTIGGFSSADMAQLEIMVAISREVDGATTRLAFVRRRQSIVAADTNQPIEHRHIEAYLGGTTADTFRQMYGLSAERIREGGRLLQNAKGDIAETLFAAATGLEHIRAVSQSIDTRLQALYSRDGKAVKPEINNALQAIRGSFTAYSGTIQSPEMVKRLDANFQEATAELKEIEDRFRRFSERIGHLGRVRATRMAAGQLHAARQRLTGLGTPPLLADTFRTRLDDARPALALALKNEQQLADTLSDQRQRRDAISVDERVTAAADTIATLLRSTGELEELDKSIQHRRDDIQRLTKANTDLFRDIAATTGRTLRETATQSTGTLSQIESLIQEHGGVTTACVEREGQLRDGQKKLESLVGRLAGLVVVGDTSELKRRLGDIRDAGDVETRYAASREKVLTHTEAYEALCQRLGGQPTTIPVESLRVPSLEEVREFRERMRSLEKDAAELDSETCKTKAAITSLESLILLLEQGADLPGEGELQRLRGDRDAILTEIAAAACSNLSAQAASSRFEELSLLVKKADALADRLLTLADSVSQRRQHRIAIEGHHKHLGHIEERRQLLASQSATVAGDWVRLWEPAGVAPKTPLAMEAWLGIHAECRKQAESLGQLRRELDGLERQINGHRIALGAMLVELGEQPVIDATRRQLLDKITHVLDDRQAQVVARKETEDQIAEAKQQIPRLKALAEEATKNRDTWNVQWAECMNVLDQPTDVSMSTGRFLLDTMRKVAGNEAAIAAAQLRIEQMQGKQTAIHEVMRKVCAALDVAFDPAGIQSLSSRASDRLRANETAMAQRESLDDDIAKTEGRISAARAERSTSEAILKTLRAEAQVDEDESLDQSWELSQDFRQAKKVADDAEQAFLREAGNADPTSLLNDCLAATAEGIEQELTDIERETEKLRERRDSVRDRQKHIQAQLDSLGNDRSTRAATDLRMHEAAVLERVREYIPLRLASLALARASRRYRDEHHAPVLGRASEFFKRITCGSYAEIRLAENELYAVRLGTRPITVPQRHMSEGTRDQIYLALRLAALEHSHAQGTEPMPLILDDGLVHFDDKRTNAMLEVLADVSAGMQVILFTHHASVAAAARVVQARKPDAVFLHGDAA
jgi:uncharacterized protein YhaN